MFIAAPLAGAIVAAIVYLLLRMEPKKSAAAVADKTEITEEPMDDTTELEDSEDAEFEQLDAAEPVEDVQSDENK